MQYNVQTMNIPSELQRLPQWVCWKYTTKANGERTKTPVRAQDGANASSTNPTDWTTFGLAVKAYDNTPSIDGIGFVFTKEAGYIGIDLDDCLDEAGNLLPQERTWVANLNSYAEISPSGKGVKVFFKGTLPETLERRSFGGNGIYDSGRFFTVTGNTYKNFKHITEVPEEVTDYLTKVWFPVKEHGAAHWAAQGEVLTDSEVITIANRAANGDTFNALYRGDWESLYSSQSEADAALCTLLAFYAGPNHAQVDRLFRASGLYREKWEEQRGGLTYGEKTVEHVVEQMDEYYTPRVAMTTTYTPNSETEEEMPAPAPKQEREVSKKTWKRMIEGYPALALPEMPLYLRRTVEHLMPLGACFVSDWLEVSTLGFYSSLFNGKKFENLPLNLWTLAIANQGTGKSVVADELDTIAHKVAARLGNVTLKYSSGSSAGLIRRMEGSGRCTLAYFSEWSGFAKGMDADHSSNMREVLMDLYDGRSIYHQLAQETVSVVKPHLCINGLTTPHSWAHTADSLDMGSGFYSRFMFLLPDLHKGTQFATREGWETEALAAQLATHLDNLPGFFQCAFKAGRQGPRCYQDYILKLDGPQDSGGIFDMDNALLMSEEESLPSGRLKARVKRVSALLEVLDEQPDIRDEVLYVRDEYVALAIRLVQRAAAFAVRSFGLLARSKDDQDASRVKRIIENFGPVGTLGIMQQSGLNRADVTRAIELLSDEGLVTSRIQEGKRGFMMTGRG